jgi:hypothetical protein
MSLTRRRSEVRWSSYMRQTHHASTAVSTDIDKTANMNTARKRDFFIILNLLRQRYEFSASCARRAAGPSRVLTLFNISVNTL